jgi:hypothetical protein
MLGDVVCVNIGGLEGGGGGGYLNNARDSTLVNVSP